MPNNFISHSSEENKFDEWNGVKKLINRSLNKPYINEREVWWASCGKNVQTEIFGKGPMFRRPVLVYKKLSNVQALCIPLTSKRHSGSWYVEFKFLDGLSYAVLSQVRVLNTARFDDKMGEISRDDFAKIRGRFFDLYLDFEF